MRGGSGEERVRRGLRQGMGVAVREGVCSKGGRGVVVREGCCSKGGGVAAEGVAAREGVVTREGGCCKGGGLL